MSKRNSQFHDYVVYDLLSAVPEITSRAMFGGYGIYQAGKIFAIIVEGELYVKENKWTRDDFEREGAEQFTYTKKDGKRYAMKYWRVPESVLENPDTFGEWVEQAIGNV